MSTSRAQGESRRERERRAQRKERLIIGGMIGLLAVAGVVVLIGLYITQYLPPRAHVLRVGDNDYNASEVARRAVYELQFRPAGFSSDEQLVDDTLLRIQDAEVVLRRAPAIVGDVSDEELGAELHERLGFEDSDDERGFADAFATLLRLVGLSRNEYNEIVRGEMLVERLRDGFAADVGEDAEQLLISRIRVADEATAEEVRELARGEADFAELARERTAETHLAEDGGNLGWQPLAALSPNAQAALREFEAGEISLVVRERPFFDVYRVVERDASRPLEKDQIETLISAQYRDWIESERPAVEVAIDLSNGEERWILERIASDLGSGQSRAPVTSAGGGS